MNAKAFLPSGKGSNLILGISTENQIFFLLRTPAAVKFFTQLSKKDTLTSLGGASWGHWTPAVMLPIC